ncbi:D-amino-acid transaminase [Brevibacillus sp. SYSU BS000544]|uniref:D-amino-acid transaminase n=1 Tax=Brevibacillus sp. SYSU BS000544 TaxID=3416443 RepID=UPI003CE54448
MYYVNGAWFEADFLPIHPEDRGYQFGDGIYEVVRIYKGKYYQLEEHLVRLQRSAKELHIVLPWTFEELQAIGSELLLKNNITSADDAVLYLQITRGAAERQFEFPNDTKPTLTAYLRKKDRPMAQLKSGIKVISAEDIRWLRCDIKSLNLLGAVLAKQAAKSSGVHDAVLHRGGTVTEGSASNLFAVKDGTLYTHPATNLILHGITRSTVLALAASLAIPVKEEPFTLDFFRQADEAFLTGTTSELTPIIAIDHSPVGTDEVGPIVRKLQEAFEQQIYR